MSNNLISDVIVPVLSAAIGAGIGGWIAFLIAKHKFSLENRDEGRAGLNTMSFWLSEVCEKCSHAIEVIKIKPVNDSEWEVLLSHISGKHTVVDELLRTMGITKPQWESHQEHILRLAMTDITKGKDRCENFKKIYRDISRLIWDTEHYVKTFNDLTKNIKFEDDGHPKEKTMNDAKDPAFWDKIANTKVRLDAIQNDCREISENINKALTVLKH